MINPDKVFYSRATLLTAACAAVLVLLAACQPAAAPTLVPPLEPTTAALTVQPTQAPPAAPAITIDENVEIVAAVPPDPNAMWWGPMPQHSRMHLKGYPAIDNPLQPEINIYPVAELAAFNENAARAAADLNALLQNPQPAKELPFLPLQNAKQALVAQVKYLDFKNGKGVRYLVEYNQGPVMINNQQLVYTFQGLSSDGKYYISAVLPVTHPELPSTQKVYSENAEDLKKYPDYIASMIPWLDQQPASSYTPDLGQLDALIQSLEVK